MGKLRLTEVKALANVRRSLKYRSFDLAPGGLRGARCTGGAVLRLIACGVTVSCVF